MAAKTFQELIINRTWNKRHDPLIRPGLRRTIQYARMNRKGLNSNIPNADR